MTVCESAKRTDLTGAPFSTYRIGGPVEEAYQPSSLEEAMAVLHHVCETGKPLTIIGGGSNLIVASDGISGITLITKKMTWINDAVSEDCETADVVFGAGVHLAKASKVVEGLGMTGAEYMVGIPGTIGGAVRMNAGALGQETADVVSSVSVFNLETGSAEHWPLDKLAYRYRHSAIDPLKHVVLEARMHFKQGEAVSIREKMQGSIDFRKENHPTDPNGGSVFKNPYPRGSEKAHMTAGWMLDQLGAKQWSEGSVRVSPIHANFIVNTGEGTSTELLTLMLRMKRGIKEAYGVEVSPENLFIGDATSAEIAMWKELTGGADVGSHE